MSSANKDAVSSPRELDEHDIAFLAATAAPQPASPVSDKAAHTLKIYGNIGGKVAGLQAELERVKQLNSELLTALNADVREATFVRGDAQAVRDAVRKAIAAAIAKTKEAQ